MADFDDAAFWREACAAFGLSAEAVSPGRMTMGSYAGELLLAPPREAVSEQLIQKFKDTAPAIDIHLDSFKDQSSCLPCGRYLTSIRPPANVVRALDQTHPSFPGGIFGQRDRRERSDGQRRFIALLYVLMLHRCLTFQGFVDSESSIPRRPGTEDATTSYIQGPFIAWRDSADISVAYDSTKNRVHVKKCLSQDGHSHLSLAQMKEEIIRAKNLSHIIQVLDILNINTKSCTFVMEYLPGGTVAEMISVLGALTEDGIRAICRQLVDGLAYLHNQDPPIVHRAIRGSNILLTFDGRVKISGVDVGISRPQIKKNVLTWAGIIPWLSPEQIGTPDGTPTNSRGRCVDIWAFGCTIVEMLEGGHPSLDPGPNPTSVMMELLHRIGNHDFPRLAPERSASAALGEMLQRIFVPEMERMGVEDLKAHRWITQLN
ncbi:kinase-like domain-containing protein [Mycena amicta]|nr:kinase-like domain-containing protein [Mycena amicta]